MDKKFVELEEKMKKLIDMDKKFVELEEKMKKVTAKITDQQATTQKGIAKLIEEMEKMNATLEVVSNKVALIETMVVVDAFTPNGV